MINKLKVGDWIKSTFSLKSRGTLIGQIAAIDNNYLLLKIIDIDNKLWTIDFAEAILLNDSELMVYFLEK